MLGYLTTSFREYSNSGVSGRRITTAMWKRLAVSMSCQMDMLLHPRIGLAATASLYAAYLKEGGDRRTTHASR